MSSYELTLDHEVNLIQTSWLNLDECWVYEGILHGVLHGVVHAVDVFWGWVGGTTIPGVGALWYTRHRRFLSYGQGTFE